MVKRFLTIGLIMMIIGTSIFQNETYAAKNMLDIVFIIDRSGSMGDDINNVKSNINAFVNQLEAEGITYRLGLVSYERNPFTYPMTSDVSQFKQNLSSIHVDGGTENGLDAIMTAMNDYTFEYRAIKYFVLIGDEKIYSSHNRYDDQDIINELNDNDIILTAVGINRVEEEYSNIAYSTNGMYLDLNTDFGNNLEQIFEQIQNIPAMTINFPEQNQYYNNSQAFIPSISVSDEDSDILICSYSIDDNTDSVETKQITNTISEQQVTFSAFDVSTLSEGWHTFYFTVDDGTESIINEVEVYIDYSSPIISDVQYVVTDDDIEIQVYASDSASGLATEAFQYTIDGESTSWKAFNFHTFSGLQPNTSYSIDFNVRDQVENSSNKTATIITDAQIPQITINEKRESSLTLKTIDKNPSTTEYQIQCGNQYVNGSGYLSSTPQWITLSSKMQTIRGLSKNTSYSIQVKARNQSEKETGWSNAIIDTTLAPTPKNISAEPSQNEIYISFDTIQGVAGYEIEIDSAHSVIVSTPYYTHKNLQADTPHSYRVRSINQGGAGNYSQPVSVSTLPYIPDVPINLVIEPSQESMTISWDESVRADYYELEVDGQVINVDNHTSYIHTELETETEHHYRVRAINKGGSSEFSEVVSETTLPYPPVKVTNIGVSKTNTSITLSFDPVEKADHYELEVDNMIIDIGNQTTYTHSGLQALTAHQYKVRGVNRGGKGPWSEELNVVTHPNAPHEPTSLFGTSTENEVSVMFNSVDHADSYEIEIDGQVIKNITTTSYEHTGLQPSTEHSYRVRAINITGKSEWSRPFTTSTLEELPDGQEPMALTNIGAIVTNRTITISWEAVAVEATYQIEVDGEVIDIGNDKIYNHSELEANSFHKYRIIATRPEQEPVYCGALTLSTLPDPPDAPDGLEASSGYNYVQLNWNKVDGADYYELEVDGEIINLGNSDAYLHDDLLSGTSHGYKIRAVNVTGVTGWSEPVIISTTNPEYIIHGVQGQYVDVTTVATNVQDFTGLKYIITYDPNILEVIDLSLFTQELEKMSTNLQGAKIRIHYEAGRIEIEVDQTVVPGTSFDGEINTIRFRVNQDAETSIHLLEEHLD